MTIADAIYDCKAAAAEALAETNSKEAAALAYRSNMPQLDSLASARLLVGCVSAGLAARYISQREANLFMQGVSLWLMLEKGKQVAA